MFKVVLCLCLILSFRKDKRYLDAKLVLEKECVWVLVKFMLVMLL